MSGDYTDGYNDGYASAESRGTRDLVANLRKTEALEKQVAQLKLDGADCAENHYSCEEVAVLRELLRRARGVITSGLGWEDDEASVEIAAQIKRALS